MLTQCPHCQKAIIVPEPGIHTCSRCQARIWINDPASGKEDRVLISPEALQAAGQGPSQQTESGESSRPSPLDDPFFEGEAHSRIAPWEQRKQIGWVPAFRRTWRLSTFLPSRFFHHLKTDVPAKGVVVYGWLILTLAYIAWALYRLLFMPYLVKAGGADPVLLEEQMTNLAYSVLVGAPLISMLSIVLNAVLFHAVLRLLDSARGGFGGTFRVVVYATSPMLFMLVPIFGDFVAFVWNMVASITGLARVHEIGKGRAMLVVFLPPLAFYLVLLLYAKLTGSAPAMLP